MEHTEYDSNKVFHILLEHSDDIFILCQMLCFVFNYKSNINLFTKTSIEMSKRAKLELTDS